MKKNNISGNTAILAAIQYVRITEREVGNIDVRRADGLYEVTFETDWMTYDCYVDAADGEVLGFDCSPVSDPAALCEQALIPA